MAPRSRSNPIQIDLAFFILLPRRSVTSLSMLYLWIVNSIPFTRQDNNNNDDGESERSTGVFMMADGLPLYNSNSDNKAESHDEEEGDQNNINDKMDFSKLWQSHTTNNIINKETTTSPTATDHHHGKKDSKISSSSSGGPKREGPTIKEVPTDRISSSSSKVVRKSSSKGGRLRVGSSFNNKYPSKGIDIKIGKNDIMKNNHDSNRRSRHSNRGRSKSLPQHQQRQQRERVPLEHHVQKIPHQSSTLSSYRLAFLEEMAQSNMDPG